MNANIDKNFSLLETLRWHPADGYFLLPRHLARMRRAAAHFGFPYRESALLTTLSNAVRELPPRPHRVRLLLDAEGNCQCQSFSLELGKKTLRVCLAPWPVDPHDPFLHHKTTRRDLYQQALAACPGYDEVILWNLHGEVTEACTANLAVYFEQHWLTPPVECGLLDGTLRAELAARGLLREARTTPDMLRRNGVVYLINSVRLWRRAELD